MRWYRLAAKQGDAGAQFSLGIMYGTGNGVPLDYVAAYMWYNLAAAQGSKKAKKNRELISSRMTRGQVADGQRRAREWKPITK